MYTNMDRRNGSSPDLPPGFRFHPTDEELIVHYLRNQAMSRPCPISIIPEVDIYKFDPWELPDKAEVGEKEWYFFTPRDRKYPNGVRPNRATISGYWKATGTDKAIQSGPRYVGVKKALVFYHGKPPKGVKTDWIMHEYRVTDARTRPAKLSGSMRLDEWVLCRIYKRKPAGRTLEPREEDSSDGQITTVPAGGGHDEYDHSSGLQQQTLLNLSGSTSCSLPPLMEMENMGNISQQILTDNSSFPTTFDFQNIMGYDATGGTHHRVVENLQHCERQSHQLTDTSPYHVMMNNHTCSFLNQPIFVNPVIDQYP